MKSAARTLLAIVLISGAGGALYWWQYQNQPESQPAPEIPSPAPSPMTSSTIQPEASPSIQYPVPAETGKPKTSAGGANRPTLPAVDESDPSLEESLRGLVGKERLAALFNLKNLVRRIVVTVDNATGPAQPSQEFSPLKELDSTFRVTGKRGAKSIAPLNFQRYSPYVGLARAVDARKAVDIYVHFYPLFQSAYQDLGKPGYFNDRMIQVLDHLLATPEIKSPIKVARPTKHNRYKYVDDELEALSSSQKILVRMGSENAHAIQEKLREIRKLLIHAP